MPQADIASAPELSLAWVGERAILVRLAPEAGPEASRRVAAVAEALMAAPPSALQEVVPAYTSVLALLDPFALANVVEATRQKRAVGRIARAALQALVPAGDDPGGRLWRVPVAYGGEEGPDLEAVARMSGRTPAEVVRIHSAHTYSVMAVGFRPGYPFMGFVDDRIAAPRLDTHRQRVEAGSVGIAGRQTGIYARASSGGWQILGRTAFVLFDDGAATADEACRMHVGDRVEFVPTEVR